jgi:hypothetical protein
VLGGDLERALRRRVHSRDSQLGIELHDGVHCALDEARELRLTRPDLPLHPEPPELGGGSPGEDLEQRPADRIVGHPLDIEHRQMAEHAAVEVHQRHAHVADRSCAPELRVMRIQIEDPIRVVHEPAVIHHHLTRRAVDGRFPALDPLSPEPECQRPEAAPLGVELGHPGPTGSQRAGQVLHQGAEEALADLAGGALQDAGERGLRRCVRRLAGGRQHDAILPRHGAPVGGLAGA